MKKFIPIHLLLLLNLLIGVSAYGATTDYLSRYETDYEIYDLGAVSSGDSSAYGINNNLIITGNNTSGSGSQTGIIYSNNNGFGAEYISGTTFSFSKTKDINDAGQVVGYTTNGKTEAFIYQNGSLESLGSLGGNSYANGLNNWGQVVGSSQTDSGETHGFIYNGYSMKDIGTLGGNYSVANDISDLGGVIGTSSTADGNDHAFLYSAGTGSMTDIGTLGGDNSYGNAININGHATGYSETSSGDTHAFYYDGDEMYDIGTLGGDNSFAFGMNDFGFVVGYSETEDGESHAYVYHEFAFWYSGTTMIDLNDFLPEDSDWDCITKAYDINEWGQIVGVGKINGSLHAFLLNPTDVSLNSSNSEVPLPGTSLLLCSCITLFGMSIRRKK